MEQGSLLKRLSKGVTIVAQRYRWRDAAALAVGVALVVGPVVSAASAPQADAFAGTSLNAQIWTKTLGSAPSLTAHPGWLTLSTVHAPVAAFATTPPDAVLQPATASANWTVSVQMTFFGKKFNPMGVALPTYQGGGIIAWQNASNWVHVRWQPSSCNFAMQAVVADQFSLNQNSSASENTAACTQANDPLWLRLQKQGNTYTGSYSTNGNTWTVIAQPETESSVAPTYLGVMATEGGTNNPPNDVGFRDFSVGSGSVAAGGGTSTAPRTSASEPAHTTTSTVAKTSTSTTGSAHGALPKTGGGPLPLLAGMVMTAFGVVLLQRKRP